MKLVIVTLLFTTFVICDGNGIECPDQFINLNKGCYHFSTNGSNWLDAFVQCQRMNAALLSIESVEENFAIKLYLHNIDEKQPYFYWTSGTDAFEEGKFKWMSTFEPFTYTDWCHGEPNNASGIEHCVHLYGIIASGHKWCWNDIRCDVNSVGRFPMKYICERKHLNL